MSSSRILSLGSTLLAILLAFTNLLGCSVNPVTGKRQVVIYSEDQEIAIGKSSHFPASQSQGVVKPIKLSNSSYALQVTNNSSVPIRNLRLAVIFSLEGRRITPTRYYAVSQTLTAVGRTTLPFSMNLTAEQEARLSVSCSRTSLSL